MTGMSPRMASEEAFGAIRSVDQIVGQIRGTSGNHGEGIC